MSNTGNKRVKRVIRNKEIHNGALLVFLAMLAAVIFIVNIVAKDKTFSPNENRSLAQKPQLSKEALQSGTFFTDYTTYYSDQFPMRDLWMSLKFRADYIMNQRKFSDVFVGKNGTLLQDPTVPDQEAVAGTQAAINRFAERFSDKDISLLIVPDAATIWRDKLPKNAPVRNQAADIYEFTGPLNSSIRRIDAAEALSSHASEDIYYKTDHHWTSLGAYNVFLACTDPLKLAHEGIVYTPHVVTESFQGTLSSRSGDHRNYDVITVYEPQGADVQYEVNYPDLQKRSTSLFVSDQLKEKDQYTVFFGGNHPLVEIRTTANNGRNLLVFKDSYANSFIQFLTPYYQTIVMVDPRYYYDDVSLAMNTYGITDVMFLYSADTLLNDTALADVLNAATSDGTAADTGVEDSTDYSQEETADYNSGESADTNSEVAETADYDSGESADTNNEVTETADYDSEESADTNSEVAETADNDSGESAEAAENYSDVETDELIEYIDEEEAEVTNIDTSIKQQKMRAGEYKYA